MIRKEVIKEILLENRLDVEKHEVVVRDMQFESFSNYVLIGARRAGKSFMLYQQIQENLKKGMTWDSMLYINFEDERLINMTTDDLNTILEVHGMMSAQRPTLFLDEIQNIPGWDKFVRRLADNKYRVFITGSNARMLSSDVATTLGGRYMLMHVLPYNFMEYLIANKTAFDENTLSTTSGRAEVQRLFQSYYRFGGFPESATFASKRDYLTSVYQKIYLGDIAARNHIENTFALRFMFRKMAESIMQPLSHTRLTNLVKSTGAKVSKTTIINYVEYAKNAFLIYQIKNIADNIVGRETNPKYYFVDNGIVSLLTFDNDTSLLENMVAIELLRRFGIDDRVFFYHRGIEVDFYIPDNSTAIQVSYNPRQSDETWQRETSALLKLHKLFNCRKMMILTYEDEETVVINGETIQVIPVWKWMLLGH